MTAKIISFDDSYWRAEINRAIADIRATGTPVRVAENCGDHVYAYVGDDLTLIDPKLFPKNKRRA